MEIQSEPGSGTRVVMRFPACEAEDAAASSAPEARPARAGRNLQVLLVDDDLLVLKATRDLVETLGHTVTTAMSGEEALELVAGGLASDAVILDLNMPGMGGAGTLPRLRALRPDLPVLLATGRADQAALDLVEAHAGVSLLAKPFSSEELRRQLALEWSLR
jgi:CheY-like chemotaxis protein